MPDVPRPSPAQIRRALAECMTVGDIDDAMGWEPGTARRRRWRDRARGGLPFADAELGGVALWFRATVEEWRARTGDVDDEAEDEPEPDEPVEDEPDEDADGDTDGDEGQEQPDEPGPVALASGYELEPGQRVLVEVRGSWREAHVRHRDRATVSVDYTVDGTPAGLRRQRVGLDRIRVPGG